MRVIPTQDLDVMPRTVQHRNRSHMANVVLAIPCCLHSFVPSMDKQCYVFASTSVRFFCSRVLSRTALICLSSSVTPNPLVYSLPPSQTNLSCNQHPICLHSSPNLPPPTPLMPCSNSPSQIFFLQPIKSCCMSVQAMQPGLTVTSVPLNIDVPPSPRGTLAPAVSYKLIKLDQSESKDGSDPTPKFVLAGQDANDPLLPTSKSKHLKNRKVSHTCCVSRAVYCSTAMKRLPWQRLYCVSNVPTFGQHLGCPLITPSWENRRVNWAGFAPDKCITIT